MTPCVHLVQPAALHLAWSIAEPLLAPAVRRDLASFTLQDVYRWVKNGEHQLWLINVSTRPLAALLSQIQKAPTCKRIMVVHLAGGKNARSWVPAAVSALEGYGHLNGCTEMRVVGRHGWLRYLKPYGYSFAATILVKEEVYGNGKAVRES